MNDEHDLEYHRQRAAAELNLGLSTSSLAAARAHLRLSSLHFEKARTMGGKRPATERPIFQLS